MHVLAAICVRRPVFATVLILVLVVFGVIGYLTLGLDRFPKIEFPIVTVMTVLPGAAPEEIETEVTDKIEAAVNTIAGIDELRSVSAEGISLVYITFVLEKDPDVAAQEVRDKVNRILPDLPKDIEQPVVEKFETDAIPVLGIAVSAPPPTTIREITEYCDKVLRRQLERISGVGQVSIIGGQKRQINVHLNPELLRSYRLTVTDVARALAAQNLQIPGGSMKRGQEEYTVRTLGRAQSVEEIRWIAVANRDGRTITVGDLGEVEDSSEEATSVALYNDSPCVLLNVRKQSGTNTVEVVRAVKERLAALDELARQRNYKIEIVRDQSIFIEASVHNVQEHLLVGALLAAVVVVFFLANVRATIIAALAIPTSIISTFAIIKYMGFTLNSVTLLALTLSVGIVIDDAIVVMENIFRYIEEKRMRPFDAAIAATKEIGLAVLAITLSLVAVFLPIAFMGGIVGRFLESFGITMSATVLVSMLVSFTLTPMLAARWFRAHLAGESGDGASEGGAGQGEKIEAASQDAAIVLEAETIQRAAGTSKSRGVYRMIEVPYLWLLKLSLAHRWVVVVAAVASLACVVPLLRVVPKTFLPDDDQSEFQVSIETPVGTTLEATQLIAARMARDIRRIDGVRYTITSVADNEQRDPNKATVYVRLVDINQRRYSQFDMMGFVRQQVVEKYRQQWKQQYGGGDGQELRVNVSLSTGFSGGGMAATDLQYVIGGPDIDKLERYAQAVVAALQAAPGAVDVDSSLRPGKPQYGVKIDRPKAAELGVSVADIANTLRLMVAGDKVSDYNEAGEQYEVHVRAPAEYRNNIDKLRNVTVPSVKLGTVLLADVVKFEPGTGPAQIDRLNRTRQVTITANMLPGTSQQALVDVIQQTIKSLDMGPEYSHTALGRTKEMARTFRSFIFVFITAFIFVYLVLAAQFESWLHPITILLSLPLSFPFALLSLVLFGQSLNIFSLLGTLVLFAVIKKNSILQIDHTNQLRALGMPRYEAMIAANLDRLRPILMTTVAFVAGMIPLIVSNAAGAGVNKAISGVIIGGQSLSLLLTLLATPVAYSLFDDISQWLAWARAEIARRVRAAQPERAVPQPAPEGA